MTKEQRTSFQRIMQACDLLGGQLDYTATSARKLADRQLAHKTVSRAIYHILCNDPKNEDRKYDAEEAELLITKLEELTKKVYSDKSGRL